MNLVMDIRMNFSERANVDVHFADDTGAQNFRISYC